MEGTNMNNTDFVSCNAPENESSHFLNKKEQNQDDAMEAKNVKTGEHSSLASKVSVPTQSTTPVVLNGLPHLSYMQQLLQQGQPPLHLTQPTFPFWLPQQPDLQVGANLSPFTLGTSETSVLGSGVGGAASLSQNQSQIQSIGYNGGRYPYPGCPGLWDPSTWWVQAQQSLVHCSYPFSGPCGNLSTPPLPMPAASGSNAQPVQRGTIHQLGKLSMKHQNLWEAQSAENVKLWAIISQLQSELADRKSQLSKLEAEVSSLKQTVEDSKRLVTGPCIAGQAPKRGRPKRTFSSIDASPGPHHSQTYSQGRKPAACKLHTETKVLNFEKVVLKKVENTENTTHSADIPEQQNNKKIPNTISNISNRLEANGNNMMMPVLLTVHREMKKNGDKADHSKDVYPDLSQLSNVISSKSASGNVNVQRPSSFSSEDGAKDVANTNLQNFYIDGYK